MAIVPSAGTVIFSLAIVICGAYGVRFLVLGWRSMQSIRWIEDNGDTIEEPSSCDRQIVLLCPLYAENQWISKLVRELSSLNYHPAGLKIGFVLSEDDDSGTKSEVSKVLQEYKMPFEAEAVVVPGENKAESLNNGLFQFVSDHPDWFHTSTYIGVFDVDTSIESNMLQYVGCDDEAPVAYTGTSIYGLNLHEFRGTRKRILQAFAVMQTQWALGFEFARVINDYERKWDKLNYIVGHGSFYRWDFLLEYGFPDSVDDIPLGYLIKSEGYHIKPLPSVEIIGVTVTVGDLISQLSNWFKSGYLMFKFRHQTDELTLKTYLNLLYEPFVTILPWTFAPVLLLMAELYLIFTAPVLAIAAGLWVFSTAQYSGGLTFRSVNRLDFEEDWISEETLLGVPYFVYPFLKTAGAWHRILLVGLDTIGLATDDFRATPKEMSKAED